MLRPEVPGRLLSATVRMRLALLYAAKYGPERAAAKFMVPYAELKAMHDDPDVRAALESPQVKLWVVEEALREGFPLSEVSECISWRDFEELVTEILAEHGYTVRRNYVIRRPRRREIDVLAERGGVRLAIDCKNWVVKLTPSRIREIASRHAERCRFLKGPRAIPVVVTIHPCGVLSEEGVYFVSIDQLRYFVERVVPSIAAGDAI